MAGDRPVGVPASAHQLWDDGVNADSARPGDLWILSWDDEVLGVALIAAARDDFALAWPVTLPGEASFAPGLVIENSPLGIPVTLWPTRETGIGLHLLDRSLGRLLDANAIRPLAFALEDGEEPAFPAAPGSAWDEDNRAADRALVEHWSGLCFHLAGGENEMRLDSEKVLAAGGSSKSTAKLLGLPPQQLRPIWVGDAEIDHEQLVALAEDLGVDEVTLLQPDPLAGVVSRLAAPRFKRAIKARMAATRLNEAAVRGAARSEYTLAARDDANTADAIDRKLRDAIARAGRDQP
ncbi:hypothetical protein [Gordonia sp. FQ]|uniref:hypothetical protein n=1 Tax=Gordonia sp. FQ TaxID=3446634 RepID=UPI003F855514